MPPGQQPPPQYAHPQYGNNQYGGPGHPQQRPQMGGPGGPPGMAMNMTMNMNQIPPASMPQGPHPGMQVPPGNQQAMTGPMPGKPGMYGPPRRHSPYPTSQQYMANKRGAGFMNNQQAVSIILRKSGNDVDIFGGRGGNENNPEFMTWKRTIPCIYMVAEARILFLDLLEIIRYHIPQAKYCIMWEKIYDVLQSNTCIQWQSYH